ncbi:MULTISPECIES: hypothetical protein [Trichocoleus]|uniref:DUF5673 domain-containing protein n=1 Tax=Trichocoleus desertorum GB2-A4 TaxID=2933944 RepID=A0ABV0JF37_9CYAN|nr:hypothetical protein [Trichocoleus sp. FACHB-46]MBD1865031.1 hypothetical protein [Trichocoleus sp. FACHB-46]
MPRFFLFFILGLVVFIGLYYCLALSGIDARLDFPSSFLILASLLIWIPVLNWAAYGHRETGSLLRRVGRLQNNYLAQSLAVIYIVISLIALAFIIYEVMGGTPNFPSSLRDWSPLLLLWSFSISYALSVFSNLLVYENGIYLGFVLLKWEEITAYHWDRAEPNLLVITVKPGSMFSLKPSAKLLLPEEQRDYVGNILSTKVQATRTDDA